MLFTSIYGIVDGLCVSNFVGKTAFAAVNLIKMCIRDRSATAKRAASVTSPLPRENR